MASVWKNAIFFVVKINELFSRGSSGGIYTDFRDWWIALTGLGLLQLKTHMEVQKKLVICSKDGFGM